MPNFKTHFYFSIFFAASCSFISLFFFAFKVEEFAILFLSFALGGILPDLDMKNSTPSRIIAFLLSFLTIFLIKPITQKLFASSSELSTFVSIIFSILLGLLLFLILPILIPRFTIHRGIFHSIPAIILSFLFSYMLFCNFEKKIRLYASASLTLGYTLHLIMDEIQGFLRKKRKTVFKITGENTFSTAVAYILICGFSSYIFYNDFF